jgi:hypothetical protein
MNDSHCEARVLAEAALAAAAQCGEVKQLINGYIARVNPTRMIGTDHSDGEKYRWIRGHRGDSAISDAIAHSDRNKDFDAHIDAAMTQSDHAAAAMGAPEQASAGVQSHPLDAAAVAIRPDGRFDDASEAIEFCVGIDGVMNHASISSAVLHSHYGHADSPATLFRENSPALAEAVRDRVAGGSIQPIVLREYDLK